MPLLRVPDPCHFLSYFFCYKKDPKTNSDNIIIEDVGKRNNGQIVAKFKSSYVYSKDFYSPSSSGVGGCHSKTFFSVQVDKWEGVPLPITLHSNKYILLQHHFRRYCVQTLYLGKICHSKKKSIN